MALQSRLSILFIILIVHIISGALHSTALSSNQQQSQLIHFPVKTGFEGQDITLEAKFENIGIQVRYVRIFYRVKGVEDYEYVEMIEEVDNFVGSIPRDDVKSPTMEYFLLALLADQSVVSSPAHNPYYAPYEITITESIESAADSQSTIQKIGSLGGKALTTLILSPEPNSKITKDEAIIAVSLLFEQESINQNSIQLFLDGKGVTKQAEITTHLISYVPQNISQGKHVVKLILKDDEGHSLKPVEWNFRVEAESKIRKKKKLPFAGMLFFDTKGERITDSTITTINSGGNLRGNYGKIHYKSSFFLTSREQKDQQPRNRFLLEIGTPWIGMRFGDTNPKFNDLILWGKRVRGIEAYLKLGFLNLEFVHGETNRSVEAKFKQVLDDSGNVILTATGKDSIAISSYGTFKQTLLGIRSSFGSGRNFQLGLNFLKVKDDVRSIKNGLNPKDNVVIGPDILLAFDNHRIEFKAGAAFSLITNDISNGAVSKTEIESTFETDIPFDPSDMKEYFILNTSTTPLDPSKLTSLAYNAQFKLNYFRNSFSIQYKSIGSEYNSLGNTFLRKNIEGFAITDRISFLQNQLYFTLGYEQYLDGLDKMEDCNSNTEPTDLKTFNIGISYYPKGMRLPKVNLSFKDHNRNNGLKSMNAVGNQTQDISVQLGYDIQLFNLNHTISLNLIGSDRIDDYNPAMSNIASDIRMVTIKTNYQIPLTTTFTYAFNQSITGKDSSQFSFEYNQIGLNANYILLNHRLNINGGFNFTSALGTRQDDNMPKEYPNYQRTVFNLGGSFRITPKQYIFLETFLIKFNNRVDSKFKNEVDTSSYNDSIIRLKYEMSY